jgi:hypothetical protein
LKTSINFEGKEIEVEKILEDHFNFILFKAMDSENYYLDILLNHSFNYYDKLVKVKQDDIQDYLENKITVNSMVDKYR